MLDKSFCKQAFLCYWILNNGIVYFAQHSCSLE
jgi:hypothetical protein